MPRFECGSASRPGEPHFNSGLEPRFDSGLASGTFKNVLVDTAYSASIITHLQAQCIVGFESDGDIYYFLTEALGSVVKEGRCSRHP